MVRFKQLDYSDALAPVELRFSGDDLQQLHAVVDSAMAIMQHDPNLLLVRSNFEGTTDGLKVTLDNVESSRLGISKAMLAMNLATRFGTGIPLTTVWEGDYPVQVVLKDNHFGLQHPDDVGNATVSGVIPSVNVPLRQIADVKPDWSEGMIVRRNGVRTISVFADVQRGLNLNTVTDKVLKEVSTIHLPEGVTLKPGGQRARR
jgi:multidrug efflux pump subunit AcrB